MKRLKPFAAGLALVAGVGAGSLTLPYEGWAQDEEDVVVKLRIPRAKPGTVEPKPEVAEVEADTKQDAEPEVAEAVDDAVEVAQATPEPEAESEADETKSEPDDDTSASESSDKEETAMSDDKTTEQSEEEAAAFRQTMHEGDIALGVCGARVSALLWFYEASVAQGRDDLKSAVASLTESRNAIKSEAERRAVDDRVDTSVRVMNSESEKIWDDLNEKAGGDEKEFQKTHDELFAGVQECLALFFETPEAKASDAAKE